MRRTLPLYDLLIAQVVEVALSWAPKLERWLDTGTGSAQCVTLARSMVARCDFFLADPSESMLEVARANHPDLSAERFILAGSQSLPELEAFDVITASQCHHYGSVEDRFQALVRCRELLRADGVFVASENVRAETAHGRERARLRWRRWLIDVGRTESEANAHLQREGTQFFPICPSEHLTLMTRAGFRDVELVFRSYGQAVLVGRR